MENDLESWNGDIRLTSFVLAQTFFASAPLKAVAPQLLGRYAAWLDFAGRAQFRLYATETMKKFRPISEKTFGMLPAWLDEGQDLREFVAITLNDSEKHDEPGRRIFDVFSEDAAAGTEDERALAYLHLALPAPEGEARLAAIAEFFKETCASLPVRYATCGFGLETSPYYRREAQTLALADSMRHPGVDVHMDHIERGTVKMGAVRTVNWLTYVDAALAEEAGGAAAIGSRLTDDVRQISAPNGILLQAGERPGIGDINRGDRLPAYRAAHEALRPLVEKSLRQFGGFNLIGDDGSATERWYRRFEVPG